MAKITKMKKETIQKAEVEDGTRLDSHKTK